MGKDGTKKHLHDKYFRIDPGFSLRSKFVMDAILKKFHNNIAGLKILEIGFGPGNLLAALQERGAYVTGVEISDSACHISREKGVECEKIDLSVSPIEESKVVGEGEFDICILVEVLEHTNDYFRLIENINRSLKMGGVVFFTVPNFNYR